MILVLINWLFIFIFLSLIGLTTIYTFQKLINFPNLEISIDKVIIIGLISIVIICNTISLLHPINLNVNIGVGIATLLWSFPFQRMIITCYQKWVQQLYNVSLVIKIAWLFIFLIALLKTIAPSDIADEAGYHIPLIRWIETYRIVPGIANIEDRMGFNPCIYMANAFFSMRWLFAGGLYDLNSFLFLIFGGAFLSGIARFMKYDFNGLCTGIIQIVALVFLFRAYLTSMDADFFNIYGTIYLLLIVIDKIEYNKLFKPDLEALLLFTLFTFLITNKFSVGMLLPMALWVFVGILLNKNIKFIFWIIIFSIIIITPWLVRNYFISGYLIYPLYFIDLFQADWKVPQELTKGQYYYVSEYAKLEVTRPFNEYMIRNMSLQSWFFLWLNRIWQQLVGKVIIIGTPISLFLFTSLLVNKEKRRSNQLFILLQWFLLLAIGVWFFKIPAIRFAWGWLLVFMMVNFTLTFQKLLMQYRRIFVIGLMMLLFTSLLRSSIASFVEFPTFARHWLYPTPILSEQIYKRIDKNGIKINIATSNYFGGIMPPCFPHYYDLDITPRGKCVEDGFKIIKK